MKKLFINTNFLDARATRTFGLESEILMENAGAAVANLIRAKFKKGVKILGAIGGGNNGADALTALRMLSGDYETLGLVCAQNLSKLCQKQLEIAVRAGVRILNLDENLAFIRGEILQFQSAGDKAKIWRTIFSQSQDAGEFLQNFNAACVIDGIFGSGLNRELSENHVRLIGMLNELNAYKIACDMPSGLDENGNTRGACFTANVTVAMGARKLALYSDEAKDFTGKIRLAKLGVSAQNYDASLKFNQKPAEKKEENFENSLFKTPARIIGKDANLTQNETGEQVIALAHIEEEEAKNFLLQKSDLRLPVRAKQNVNKGNFGHAFIIAGEMSGAAITAARAANAIGAGLVSVVGEREILGLDAQIMQCAQISEKMNAGALGMGLGAKFCAGLNFEILAGKSLVIDADMLREPRVIELARLNGNTVLTPHPKEFVSLLNFANFGEFDVERVQKNRFELAREFSLSVPCVLVLKGANTIIARAGKLYVMRHGDASLAKGGSGDALAGIIAGLLAQGYEALDAAISGTLAHALGARKFKGANYAMSANDVIEGIKCLRKK